MPTSIVTFEFRSPQFGFESGQVHFSKGGRLRSADGQPRIGELRDGIVTDVLVEGPIEFDAILGHLTVVRRSDGRRYEIPYLPVTGNLHHEALRTGRVIVDLQLATVVVLRVEDAQSRALAGATVSVNIPNSAGTLEGPTNVSGEMVLLGAVGSYSASIVAIGDRFLRNREFVRFEIKPADVGERVIVLRAP